MGGEDWGTMIWSGAAQVPALDPFGWTFLLGVLVGAAVLHYRRPLSKAGIRVALAALAIAPLIAIAQVTLPHTFANGTVADADQVNANFEAILADTGRFTTTVAGGPSVPPVQIDIPTEVIDQLCKDLDGCAISLFRVRDQLLVIPQPLPTAQGDARGQWLGWRRAPPGRREHGGRLLLLGRIPNGGRGSGRGIHARRHSERQRSDRVPLSIFD